MPIAFPALIIAPIAITTKLFAPLVPITVIYLRLLFAILASNTFPTAQLASINPLVFYALIFTFFPKTSANSVTFTVPANHAFLTLTANFVTQPKVMIQLPPIYPLVNADRASLIMITNAFPALFQDARSVNKAISARSAIQPKVLMKLQQTELVNVNKTFQNSIKPAYNAA
jgi:hypothetical protein